MSMLRRRLMMQYYADILCVEYAEVTDIKIEFDNYYIRNDRNEGGNIEYRGWGVSEAIDVKGYKGFYVYADTAYIGLYTADGSFININLRPHPNYAMLPVFLIPSNADRLRISVEKGKMNKLKLYLYK